MKQFKFAAFNISFDPHEIEYETYKNDSYYGIIFKNGDAKYDLVHHYFDWTRMIISDKENACRDLPFHEGTFRFLPSCVKVERLV